MSFANQALSVRYIAENAATLAAGVYDVPQDIDKEVARLKLDSLGVRIDQLTEEQRRYLASWDMGT
jgi:adenosylhomocysteinase